MELKTDNQCDGTRVLWGEGFAHVRFAIGTIMLYKSDRKPLHLWRRIVSTARYHMCLVSFPRTSVNLHTFSNHWLLWSFLIAQYSSYECYKPDISDLHGKEYKRLQSSVTWRCVIWYLYGKTNDIMYQKAVILVQTSQWIVFYVCLPSILENKSSVTWIPAQGRVCVLPVTYA